MKEITILRGGKHIKKEIFWLIFDIGAPLMEDAPEYKAVSPREALDRYMVDKNIIGRVKRSRADDSRFGVSPFFYDEGRRYRAGNRQWYSLL